MSELDEIVSGLMLAKIYGAHFVNADNGVIVVYGDIMKEMTDVDKACMESLGFDFGENAWYKNV